VRDRTPHVDFGLGLALAASFLSFVLAVAAPYFLNMFWQIPDGAEILRGHIPDTIPYAIAAGPLLSQEWGFEAGLAWAAQHGVYGSFVVVCALAAAVTPVLAYVAVRAFGIGDVAAGCAAFLVVGSRFVGSAVRPETFAVDAFALELFLLGRMRNRVWLLPCVALWANVHASVVLAPLAAVAFAGGDWVARRSFDRRVQRSFAIAVAVGLATLITPYGLRLWSYALALTLAASPAREHLEAWKALGFDDPGAVAAVLPGLILLVWFGAVRTRRYAGELIIAAICIALTITHARYATFLVAGWAPAIARALEQGARIGKPATQRPRAPILAVLPLAILAFFSGVAKLSTPLEPIGPWQSAAGMVADHHLRGNTYAPYVWAAFLHWRGLPVRLLIDGHGDPYSKDVWNDHLALEKGRANWRDVLERRHIDVVLVPLDSPLAQAMLLEPTWRRIDVRGGIIALSKRDRISLR
jgi:hypothetical protein